MSIKNIRQQLKGAGIEASVKYLRENEKNRNEYTCMYAIKFSPIAGDEYWDTQIEVIDQHDASCIIEDYIKDLNAV